MNVDRNVIFSCYSCKEHKQGMIIDSECHLFVTSPFLCMKSVFLKVRHAKCECSYSHQFAVNGSKSHWSKIHRRHPRLFKPPSLPHKTFLPILSSTPNTQHPPHLIHPLPYFFHLSSSIYTYKYCFETQIPLPLSLPLLSLRVPIYFRV